MFENPRTGRQARNFTAAFSAVIHSGHVPISQQHCVNMRPISYLLIVLTSGFLAFCSILNKFKLVILMYLNIVYIVYHCQICKVLCNSAFWLRSNIFY